MLLIQLATTMTRSTRAILLTLALVWQVLVGFTLLGQAQKVQDLVNAMVHAQAVDHHHHDDSSLHLDDSAGSPNHYHISEAMQPVGLLPVAINYPNRFPSAIPPSVGACAVVSVFLDGLLRPPQKVA
jgi:hypothetical protein